jgi:hypothetical protein
VSDLEASRVSTVTLSTPNAQLYAHSCQQLAGGHPSFVRTRFQDGSHVQGQGRDALIEVGEGLGRARHTPASRLFSRLPRPAPSHSSRHTLCGFSIMLVDILISPLI